MDRPLIYNSDIIANVFIADTFVKRFIGYMFRQNPHHEAIMIKPCNSIHTFFMRFNIDVLFINENMEIIKKIDNLKPGRIIMPIKGAKAVIEGRSGLFSKCQVGSKITI